MNELEYYVKCFELALMNSEKNDTVNNLWFVKWGGKYAY